MSGSEVEATDESDEVDETDEGTTERDDHLADVEDGAGCTEIWEHLSEQREE
ncbi:MAG: hypothetical protein ABEJ85_03875 [Haloarculaceae archaeon]